VRGYEEGFSGESWSSIGLSRRMITPYYSYRSCVHIHRNKMSQFAPLITTAYEELIHD